MKKALLIAVALIAANAAFAYSQEDGARPERRAGGNFLAQARTEDGRIDLSKLPEQMQQERRDSLKAADKDGDGFLSQEEMRDAFPRRNEQGPRPEGAPRFGQGPRPEGGPGQGRPGNGPGQPGPGQPGFGQPRMGQPGFGMGFGPDAITDGKLDLSKLSDQIPQERKDALKAADKDGDGFLTAAEMRDAFPRPKFQFPEGKKPDFIDDDNGIVIEKLVVALKSFDKDNDGVISAEEQKVIADSVQKEFGPSFPIFVQTIIATPFGGGFGFPGPGFGGFQGRGPQGGPGDANNRQPRGNGNRAGNGANGGNGARGRR